MGRGVWVTAPLETGRQFLFQGMETCLGPEGGMGRVVGRH